MNVLFNFYNSNIPEQIKKPLQTMFIHKKDIIKSIALVAIGITVCSLSYSLYNQLNPKFYGNLTELSLDQFKNLNFKSLNIKHYQQINPSQLEALSIELKNLDLSLLNESQKKLILVPSKIQFLTSKQLNLGLSHLSFEAIKEITCKQFENLNYQYFTKVPQIQKLFDIETNCKMNVLRRDGCVYHMDSLWNCS